MERDTLLGEAFKETGAVLKGHCGREERGRRGERALERKGEIERRTHTQP
jgi:hypothetical protein